MTRLAALVAALLAIAARADGAFPDSVRILLPEQHLDRVVLATNFGLLFTIDHGASWWWMCEQTLPGPADSYALGAESWNRLFSPTQVALAYSDSDGCSWN